VRVCVHTHIHIYTYIQTCNFCLKHFFCKFSCFYDISIKVLIKVEYPYKLNINSLKYSIIYKFNIIYINFNIYKL